MKFINKKNLTQRGQNIIRSLLRSHLKDNDTVGQTKHDCIDSIWLPSNEPKTSHVQVHYM